MKKTNIVLLLLVSVFLCGCESLGWSDNAFRDLFTPGVNADTYERSWDKNGKPREREVQSEPAYLYDAEAKKAQQ